MTRRSILAAVAIVVAAAAIGFALYAKSASAVTPGVIGVAGDVVVEENVVCAPSITYPTPDYTVGITTSVSTSGKRAAAAPVTTSRAPTVSVYLSETLVAEGAHVATGDVVARLDTAMLELGVQQAETARAKTSADLDVLDNNLDKMADARAKLVKTRATLLEARASLVATMGVLTKIRASLVEQITLIEQIIAQPGGPPPHVPPYPVLLQGLQQALAGLNKGLTGAKLGLATMNRGLAKLSTGLAQLDAARKQLKDVRKLTVINLDAQGVALKLAKARQDAATIVAPVAGLVTFARLPGQP